MIGIIPCELYLFLIHKRVVDNGVRYTPCDRIHSPNSRRSRVLDLQQFGKCSLYHCFFWLIVMCNFVIYMDTNDCDGILMDTVYANDEECIQIFILTKKERCLSKRTVNTSIKTQNKQHYIYIYIYSSIRISSTPKKVDFNRNHRHPKVSGQNLELRRDKEIFQQ